MIMFTYVRRKGGGVDNHCNVTLSPLGTADVLNTNNKSCLEWNLPA